MAAQLQRFLHQRNVVHPSTRLDPERCRNQQFGLEKKKRGYVQRKQIKLRVNAHFVQSLANLSVVNTDREFFRGKAAKDEAVWSSNSGTG